MPSLVPASGNAEPSEAEDLQELHRDRGVELLVGARRRLAVGPPALEARGVAEPIALQVLVGDLGDEVEAQRLPREVLARVPPALRARSALTRDGLGPRFGVGLGPAAPRVIFECTVA